MQTVAGHQLPRPSYFAVKLLLESGHSPDSAASSLATPHLPFFLTLRWRGSAVAVFLHAVEEMGEPASWGCRSLAPLHCVANQAQAAQQIETAASLDAILQRCANDAAANPQTAAANLASSGAVRGTSRDRDGSALLPAIGGTRKVN